MSLTDASPAEATRTPETADATDTVESSTAEQQPRYRVHRAVVVARTQLAPRFVRVTLGGPGLRGFRTSGAAAKTKIFLPAEPGAELVLPRIDENLRFVYPEGARPAIVRTYTVRDHRPESGEVDIDFAIHQNGPAALWAATAQPGSAIGISDGNGQLPPTASDVLFVGDPASLPAIETLAEELGADASIRIILLACDHDDEVPLAESLSDTACRWVHAPHGTDAGDVLVSAVCDELTRRATEHVWVSGESSSLKALRRYLRTRAGFAKNASPVVGNWQRTMATDEFEGNLFARVREAMTAGAELTRQDVDEMTVDE
ncbi:siderophore-interacting protein [Streptomyces sp. NPDC001279]|uniref:siderophore-interacting protein n=1 Tax=Streptomyces sp. NPDC001279 TaxID=3364556 RepID=UPI0036AF41BE